MDNPRKRLPVLIYTGILLILFTCPAWSQEIKTRYATVRYTDEELLHTFDNELYLGRPLTRILRQMKALSKADEVKNKVDLVVEKVETVLDMFPPVIQFTLVLLPSRKDVQQVYKEKYGKRVDHIAYYSLSEKTIYISARDASLQVVAHEFGHMIVDQYFKVRPPYRIHEVLAQYAEKHVTE